LQDEVGAPPALSAEEGVMETRAECRQGLLPCKDNKCYCCIGGGTRQCYATLAECRHACLPLNTN
uniref:Maternally expressed gene14 n=1 Tax=Zea mays TaxID=4577 RepID=UPI001CFC46E7|nr:Chain A, Maternally expressed gene14 [Zea mays]